jgi:hypothetical protein
MSVHRLPIKTKESSLGLRWRQQRDRLEAAEFDPAWATASGSKWKKFVDLYRDRESRKWDWGARQPRKDDPHLRFRDDPHAAGKAIRERMDAPRYEISRRPIVSYGMYPFCSEAKPRKPLLGHFYLPVVRYLGHSHAHALQSQMEFEDDVECRYFFWEPNSTILMDMGRCLVTAGKVDAYFSLRHFQNTGSFTIPPDVDPVTKYKEKWSSGSTWGGEFFGPPHSRFEVDSVAEFAFVDDPRKVPVYVSPHIPGTWITPFTPVFANGYFSVVSKTHDNFDSSICEIGRSVGGIDTIVLQHEPGEFNSTTEIVCIDKNPYRRLVKSNGGERVERYMENSYSMRYRSGDKGIYDYPEQHARVILQLVWFPQLDGVLVGSGNGGVSLARPEIEDKIIVSAI